MLATDLTPALAEWANARRICYYARPFAESDLDEVFLVVNTLADEPELTQRVWELANARNILINSYDQPALCTFGMVALVDTGHLRLSISTSNTSPSLASRLRQSFEQLFDAHFASYLNALAAARERVRSKVDDRSARFTLLRALVRDFSIEGTLRYPPNWQRQVDALLTCELTHCKDQKQRCEDCPLRAEA